jgi:probable F420-dependent oxidoreductase
MEFGMQINGPDLVQGRDLAQAAEALGFRTVYFPDHLVLEGPERQRQGFPAYDPMIQAAVVAVATERIRIGQLVLCNLFRHPAVTARSVATLDELSGGRAVLGLGTGWTESEFTMTGIPFPDIGPRLRMLDEALTCIRGLWGDAPFSFEGEFYRFREASLTPRPVQRPHPPIILGGSGKGLLRIAARHADVVNVISETGRQGYISIAKAAALTDDGFREKVRFLHGEAANAGRDPRAVRVSGMIATLALTESRADAEGMAQAMAGMFGVPPAAVLSSPLLLIGTAEELVRELQRREREWGLAETIIAGQFTLETLERFGREVIPRVAAGR